VAKPLIQTKRKHPDFDDSMTQITLGLTSLQTAYYELRSHIKYALKDA
jgi:hypothetical protein